MRTAIRVAVATALFVVAIGPFANWFAPARCPATGAPSAHALLPSFQGHVDEAQAIPAFARKFNLPCSTCHTGFPYLNATGRAFMEHGYRLPDEDGKIDDDMQKHQDINSNLSLEKMLPLAIRLQSVPVTATDADGGSVQSQPFSDFDLIAFGNFYKYGSFHFAVGAGADEGFVPAGDGRLGIHPAPYFNVVAGFGGPFSADPYNTFRTGDIGLTRTEKSALTDGHDTSESLDGDAQFIEAYGRTGIVYYAVGLVGSQDLATGELPAIGMGRVALDPFDGVSIGAFGFGGRRQGGDAAGGPAKSSTNWRAGSDVNVQAGELTTIAAFVAAGDQLDGAAQTVNLGGFVEGVYVVRLEERPIFMPVVRIDWTEDGGVDLIQGSVNLSSYVFENARVGLEVSYAQPVQGVGAGDATGTVFADVAF